MIGSGDEILPLAVELVAVAVTDDLASQIVAIVFENITVKVGHHCSAALRATDVPHGVNVPAVE